jgi:hypothetical protein
MRFGRYATYHGVVYEVGSVDDKSLKLISNNPADVQRGFVAGSHGKFNKTVALSEVTEAHTVYTRALYRGREVTVLGARDGALRLYTGESFWEELGFEVLGPGWAEKEVSISEVERVWEERRPL